MFETEINQLTLASKERSLGRLEAYKDAQKQVEEARKKIMEKGVVMGAYATEVVFVEDMNKVLGKKSNNSGEKDE